MGVACPKANAIGCDRVGLAVWLRRPAVSVSATIAGWPLKLDWAGDRPSRYLRHEPRRAFDGFLQPAGLAAHLHVRPDATSGLDGPFCGCAEGRVWLGDDPPTPLVRLTIRYPDASTVVTQRRVTLSAGWG
jgi:hypothetical protein